MTCVIATKRFVCADRRVGETGGGSYSSIVKVAKNPWLITAVSGSGATLLAVKQAVKEGIETPEDLLSYIDSTSYAIVLTWNSKLVCLSEGALWPVREPVTTIGSGGDLGLGFMHGAGVFTPRVAREAQRFVAKHRADCGGGCDIRSFE